MNDQAILDGAPLQVSLFSDSNNACSAVAHVLTSRPVGAGATAYILRGELEFNTTPLTVALKVFASLKSEASQELLRRELLVSRKARHRYILHFVGTATLGGCTVLVSEFMKNGNLQEYLQRHAGTDRLRLMAQVAEAVCFLHDDVGFVHGDLKCQNVLVSDDGDALLADFGLSTAIEKSETEITTATEIRQRNSLRFSAPELLLDLPPDTGHHATPRPRSKTSMSDVYAFGMLILQTFSGAVPWHGHDNVAVICRVVHGLTPRRPGDAATKLGLTDAVWDLCLECWNFDPGHRPAMKTVLVRLTQQNGRLSYDTFSGSTTGPSSCQLLAQQSDSTHGSATHAVLSQGIILRNARPGSALPSQPRFIQGEMTARSPLSAWSSKPRVLLVDDDIVSRTVSSKFLKTFGCSFDVAQDGVAALQKMEGAKYDLILMDIVMPRLDGLSVTTLIRRFDPRTPIVSMTGNAAPGDVLNYFSHGMNDILSKPFTKDGLFIILAKFLVPKSDVRSHATVAFMAPETSLKPEMSHLVDHFRSIGLDDGNCSCSDMFRLMSPRPSLGHCRRPQRACIHCVMSSSLPA